MRIIEYDRIVETVKEICMESNFNLPDDVEEALRKSIREEASPLGKSILESCVKNAEIARKERVPICQDCGLAVFFIRLGSDLHISGGILPDAVYDGVRAGYEEGYLRKSCLSDPLFERKNSADNSPAVIHLEIVPGDTLDISFIPKGGGGENMSRLKMLPPAAGETGIEDFVVESVLEAGGNPCPPTVVGVGIGGTFETVPCLAKRALLRPLGSSNADQRYDALEKRILRRINNSGIGPQGLGGSTTSLAVQIEWAPCHLASLPVAVNLNCHAHRHLRTVL